MEPPNLSELRAIYRRDEGYLDGLTRKTRKALARLMEHERFAGTTDPVALQLLTGFVRAARPKLMLQFGTWIGYSTLVIADVLSAQDDPGRLVTVDPDVEAHETARRAVADAGLSNVVFLDGFSTDPEIVSRLRELAPFPLAYVDSLHSLKGTLAELELLFDGLMTKGGLVLFHDAAAEAAQFDLTGEGGVPAALNAWRERADVVVLEPPVFPTGCGLGLVRVPLL
jgi:predicted O-methyltransferase YrrM